MGLYVKIAQVAQRQFPVLNVVLWRQYSLAVKQTGLTSPLQGGTVFSSGPHWLKETISGTFGGLDSALSAWSVSRLGK